MKQNEIYFHPGAHFLLSLSNFPPGKSVNFVLEISPKIIKRHKHYRVTVKVYTALTL